MIRFSILALCLGILTGCDFDEAVRGLSPTPEKTASRPSNEGPPNSMERIQAVSLALQGLQDPKNAVNLSPAPYGLIPWARLYGENATAEEVLRLNERWMARVKAPESGNFEPETINQGKLHLYRALQAIAGQLPLELFNEIVASQIQNPGASKNVALEIVMMRAEYFRDFLITPDLGSEDPQLEAIGKNLEQLDLLRKLPFASDVGLVITSLKPPEDPVNDLLIGDPMDLWMERAWQEWQRLSKDGENHGQSFRTPSP